MASAMGLLVISEDQRPATTVPGACCARAVTSCIFHALHFPRAPRYLHDRLGVLGKDDKVVVAARLARNLGLLLELGKRRHRALAIRVIS